MIRARHALSLVVVVALALVARGASADEIDPEAAKGHVEAARADGFDAFCTRPPRPLLGHHRSMCALASEIPRCDALVAACREEVETPKPKSSFLEVLGEIAQKLVWLLVALAAAALVYPIVRAIQRARADRALADAEPKKAKVEVVPPNVADVESISDAELALRTADDLAKSGDLERAMSLYLAASLVALDRRGAVRLAKHRTNGEYVRLCTESDARGPLREIVREVDRIEFGGVAPTNETAASVSARARALVRRAASIASTTIVSMTVLLSLAALAGCDLPRSVPRGMDPVGDELPREVLRRTGYTVRRPETSLATLPIPTGHTDLPVVLLDPSAVPLDDDARAHLLRWVEAGGVLVLFDVPPQWASEIGVKPRATSHRDLEVSGELGGGLRYRGGRVAVPSALEWKSASIIATLGDDVYAAREVRGAGAIVVLAGSDLFTNAGAALPANATALVAILEEARRERPAQETSFHGDVAAMMPFTSGRTLLVAREEDGISPPSNPFSSLLHAGLGKGLVHALAASLVLFLAYGIRHARPRPTLTPARRAFAEHVEATGAFYRRTRAFAHALAAYGRFADLRVRERLPRGADPVTFLAARANVPAEEVERVWSRAMTAKVGEPPQGDELRTIKDLRALLAKAL
ncbi:MAG: DUF4350 domain-containing protein [Deltaproteobacteria bacterium]|nr:DUF4350 domain-containing protein [Deltaproteobacteria bacterium]